MYEDLLPGTVITPVDKTDNRTFVVVNWFRSRKETVTIVTIMNGKFQICTLKNSKKDILKLVKDGCYELSGNIDIFYEAVKNTSPIDFYTVIGHALKKSYLLTPLTRIIEVMK